MQKQFWINKWSKNEIGFHQKETHRLLVKHFKVLALPQGARVFLPLCGKTRDMAWLLSQGFRVVGIELVEAAIEQLFLELQIEPNIKQVGKLKHYHADKIDIFVGDFFDLPAEILGPVDAVYDRAAMVALPEDLRNRYTAHLQNVTNTAPQLLITFDYNQAETDGPPFAVGQAEVDRQYANHYGIKLLESVDLAGGLKGQYLAKECVWLLSSSEI